MTSISDPARGYVATELATYGFAVNSQYLDAHGLPLPRTWHELASPRYAGHVLLPVPSRVGFAPLIYEILLQRLGWEQGWALISEIAGNSELWVPGRGQLEDEIAAGHQGVGVTIDFVAASAIANGAPLKLVYPDILGISPGHVAVLRSAPHAEAARRFLAFLVSDEGQRLLAHPDIRKLPVRPSVYASLGKDYFDPFAAAERTSFDLDMARAQMRGPIDNALFDALITYQQEAHRGMWAAIHRAEGLARNGDAAAEQLIKQARAQATLLPLSDAQAAEARAAEATGGVHGRGKTDESPHPSALQQEWISETGKRYEAATRLAESATKRLQAVHQPERFAHTN